MPPAKSNPGPAPHTAFGQRRGLWLHGSSGKMGQAVQQAILAGKGEFRLVGGSARTFEGEQLHQGRPVTRDTLSHLIGRDEVELIVDFSTATGNQLLLESVTAGGMRRKAVLLGTTGLPAATLNRWQEAAKTHELTVLVAPNTSLGILLTLKAALAAAPALAALGFDIEITETHHRDKQDAPSGTANFLAQSLAASTGLSIVSDRRGPRAKGELGVHSVRGGGVYGEHEIRLLGDDEEVSITHRAFSRSLFAAGALVLGAWATKQAPGVYGLLDVKL